MTDLMNFINNILWGSVLIYLLLGTGIYFTLRTRFIQLRHFSHMFSVLKNSNKSDSAGISSFQALCTTLAARVGTGNLTGVAIALTAGGRRHLLDVGGGVYRHGHLLCGKLAGAALQNQRR